MSERGRWCKDLMQASLVRYCLAREALRRIDQLRAAVEAVERGDEGAGSKLDGLCAHQSYEGAIWVIRLDPLLQAEQERVEAMQQLVELEGAEGGSHD